MSPGTTRTVITSAIQLFLGAGAWLVAWQIARAQIHNQTSDLRIKLFDRRYAVYLAFRDFISDCAVNVRYTDAAMEAFSKETERVEFLFGPEIYKYRREVVANALAIRGILENLPCEDQPVVGSLLGYFKGSTILTDVPSLNHWFLNQHCGDLQKYFFPYLDYGSAGVNRKEVVMRPPDLPEPPLVSRRIADDRN